MLDRAGGLSRIWSKNASLPASPLRATDPRDPAYPSPSPSPNRPRTPIRLTLKHKTCVPLLLAAVLPAAAAPPVHVTYWEKWVEFEAKADQAVIDRFNQSQDGIVVDYYSVSLPDRKTLVATAGGDPPDIAGLHEQNIATFADAEALQPLDDFIRRDGMTNQEWLARYYPVYARICSHGGHVCAGISTPARRRPSSAGSLRPGQRASGARCPDCGVCQGMSQMPQRWDRMAETGPFPGPRGGTEIF